jgi:hypothetical protein
VNTEEQVHALKVTLSSQGWLEIIKPAIVKQIIDLERHWINGTRAKGEERITDDVIRGRIWSLVWLKEWEERLETKAHRLKAEQEMRDATIVE